MLIPCQWYLCIPTRQFGKQSCRWAGRKCFWNVNDIDFDVHDDDDYDINNSNDDYDDDDDDDDDDDNNNNNNNSNYIRK